MSLPPSGGWQSWTTTSKQAHVQAGLHQLRVSITAPMFNLNWIEADLLTATEELTNEGVSISPNPTKGISYIDFSDLDSGEYILSVFDSKGQVIIKEGIYNFGEEAFALDLTKNPTGVYFLKVLNEDGRGFVEKVVKE